MEALPNGSHTAVMYSLGFDALPVRSNLWIQLPAARRRGDWSAWLLLLFCVVHEPRALYMLAKRPEHQHHPSPAWGGGFLLTLENITVGGNTASSSKYKQQGKCGKREPLLNRVILKRCKLCFFKPWPGTQMLKCRKQRRKWECYRASANQSPFQRTAYLTTLMPHYWWLSSQIFGIRVDSIKNFLITNCLWFKLTLS